MNQQAYQALTKMVNAFPQSAADLRGLLLTYEEDTTGIHDQAIIDAAGRFRRGEVAGHNNTFAPSIAEFCVEARRTPVAAYRSLPSPYREPFKHDDKPTRIRMGFKMSVLSAGLGIAGGPDRVAEANRRGLEDLIALGQEWGVPVPDELFEQVKSAA